MSKTLREKINNILDIDKNREYINLSIQEPNDFIYLNLYLEPGMLEGFADNLSSLNILFKENYLEILDKLKSLDSFAELEQFINLANINFDFKSLNIKVPSKSKSKSNNSQAQSLDEENNYLYFKKAVYEKVKDILLDEVKQFDDLRIRAKQAFVSTGKQMLRVGFDFISGHVNDIYIDAPLFLYDVEIEINENKVSINKTSPKTLNEKLIIFILKQLGVNYKEWDFNKIKTIDDFKELIEPILQYTINLFDEEGKKVTHGFQTIFHSQNFYLGLFDTQEAKLKQDFLYLMDKDVKLLNKKMVNDYEYYTKDEFKNKALIQINNPLNIYQKYAIRSAINENTLIYGPPGTGKSEIITSIIANLLIKQKSILVVSEKDAALEVIKKRLNKLSIFAFYLKDIEDENRFYFQIEQVADHMGSFYNNEYKKEKYNLLDEYQNNERVLDYQKTIDNMRTILLNDIQFSLDKDSLNNDYRDYLLSIKQVESFVSNNRNGVNEFWNEYQNKFVKLQSPTEFISKVAQLNWFRNKYQLTEDNINKMDKDRDVLNKFIANSNLEVNVLDSFDKIKKNVEKLKQFLSETFLDKDNDFVSSIENDSEVLIRNYEYWSQIDDLLKNVKVGEYIKKFLIRNSLKHNKFLSKFVNLSSEEAKKNMLTFYYYKSQLSTSKLMFKKINDSKLLETFLRSIQTFNKIFLFKSNQYLMNILKYDKEIFDPLVVYFYVNSHLLKKSFVDFYNQQIMNFDQRVLYQYYKYRANQIEKELININNYNFEKMKVNKEIIEQSIPDLINDYLKSNKDFILNLDESLKNIYLKFIKNKLAKSTNEIQQKMERMFKIIKMDVKPKINDFIFEFNECLKIIFPIWISKPELISFYLPNKKEIFDFGIFDEASQMFLEKAYPMIYRCNNLIISGDDKQLKPERIIFNELDFDYHWRPLVKEIDYDKSESLLDRAKVSYWNTYTLRNHYRSQSKELIEFSNLNFYDYQLLFSTINNQTIEALEIINTKSKEANRVNKDEAKQILARLKQEISNFKKILVICFSNDQKEYLLSLINKEGNVDIKILLKQNKLVIGDLSSVQGDEADLVIISCVFSPNTTDYLKLAQPRGKNYLNVAITRAKIKIIVYKSLTKDDIKLDSNNINYDLLMFKNWISYLDQKVKAKALAIKDVNDIGISNFKNSVYEKLKQNELFKNVELVQNLAIGSINIDLAIYMKNISNINLILILDDWKKNLSIQEWFEDIDKEEYLKSRKYNVLRIREQDWLKDDEIIVDRIIDILGLENLNNLNVKGSTSKSSKVASTSKTKTKSNDVSNRSKAKAKK